MQQPLKPTSQPVLELGQSVIVSSLCVHSEQQHQAQDQQLHHKAASAAVPGCISISITSTPEVT
jgi:hypothetical protein